MFLPYGEHMNDGGTLPAWCEDTCVVCPARKLAPGEFDVIDAPARDYRLNRQVGYRTDEAGHAVCVHPYRIGIAPGRYASGDVPLPDPSAPVPEPTAVALELPDDVEDLDALDAWLIAVLRTAPDETLFEEIARAETAAGQRFAPGAVAEALRRVLGKELAHRD
jgi:hypothetical protein